MKYNIIVLSASGNNYANRRLVEEGEKRGHKIEIISPEQFVLNFPPDKPAKVYAKDDEFAQRKYDAVIPRLGSMTDYGCFILQFFTEISGLCSTATPSGILTASDKLRTTLVLNVAGLRQPSTTTVKGPEEFDFLVQSVGGLPAICKNLKGSLGDGVYIFRDELQSSVTLQNFRKEKKNVLLQAFIETAQADEAKSDIRAWVIGDEVVASMRRFSLAKDFRSNYSKSKLAEPVTLTAAEKEMAVKAAKALGLDCAGVDIARNVNEANKPYILEVNSNANLEGIEKVTGVNVALKIILHVESKLEQSRIRASQPTQAAAGMNVLKFGSMTNEVSSNNTSLNELKKSYEEAAKKWDFKTSLALLKKINEIEANNKLSKAEKEFSEANRRFREQNSH